jgi:hypothetical protein
MTIYNDNQLIYDNLKIINIINDDSSSIISHSDSHHGWPPESEVSGRLQAEIVERCEWPMIF